VLPKIQATIKSVRFEERQKQLDQELKAHARVQKVQPASAQPGETTR
jgi:hypothetical protein